MSRNVSKMAHDTVAVAATATLILAARTTRRSVTIQNIHATQTLHLGFSSAVTVANGLRVAAAGASFTIEDYNGPIWGIGSGAATTTQYLETYGS